MSSQENKTPHNFCKTPEEKCTMNYCDENGCQNRKRRLVGENKLPTAEEILRKYIGHEANFAFAIFQAMEEYKDLHTAPLREELEKLRADKESLLVRVEEVREINKQLEHEMLLVKRNNKDLEAENERLKEENGELIISNEILYQSNLHYSEQTQKLRGALERIIIEKEDSEQVSCEDIIENMVQIAENTLKSENK